MVNEKIELLKKTIHPEKQMDIITQSEIVHEALAWGGDFENDVPSLAVYLEISESKVKMMRAIIDKMLPELKDWFRNSTYQCRTAYDKAVLPEEAQRVWLHGMYILEKGDYTSNSSDTTVIGAGEN